MIKKIINLPTVREDNSDSYLHLIEGLTQHVDDGAIIKVDTPSSGGILISITPSRLPLKEKIIQNVLSLHRNIGIKTDFSKSTELQKNIVFRVYF